MKTTRANLAVVSDLLTDSKYVLAQARALVLDQGPLITDGQNSNEMFILPMGLL
jgi:hypothetical protein